MQKFIVTADWHIGTNDDYNHDVLKGAEEIGHYIKNNKIKTMIIAGDVFDKPRPLPTMYEHFGRCIEKISAANYYIIPGNHDAVVNYTALAAYSQYVIKTNIQIVDQIERIQIGESNVLFLPYFIDNDYELSIAEYVKNSTVKSDILITHANIPGAIYGAEQEIQLGRVGTLPAITKNKPKLIVSGHIHKHQQGVLGGVPFVYPGSLARVSHSEEKEKKGFIVVNEDYTIQFVVRKTARKWATVTIDWNGKLPEINRKADVLRLQIRAPQKYRGNIDKTKIELSLSKKFAHVKTELSYSQKSSTEVKKIAKGLSFEEYESKWIDLNAKGIKGPVRTKIQKIMKSIEYDSRGPSKYKGLTLVEINIKNYQSIEEVNYTFKPHDCIGLVGEIDGTMTQSNGSGKTSVEEAIRWGLYGSTRYSKNSSAIRDGSKEAQCTIVLATEKNRIQIQRKMTGSQSDGSVVILKGAKEELAAKGSADVTKWVEHNFGLSLKTFDAIIFIGGVKKHNIIGAKPTDRLKALQEPLLFERYTKSALELVKKERSENKGTIDRNEGVLEEYQSKQLSDIKVNELYQSRDDLNNELEAVSDVLTKAKKDFKRVDKEIDIIEHYEKEKNGLEEHKSELEKAVVQRDKEKSNYEKCFMENIKKDIKKVSGCIDTQNKQLNSIMEEGTKYRTLLDQLEEDVVTVQEVTDPVCPLCNKSWSLEEKDQELRRINTEIEKYRELRIKSAAQYKEKKTERDASERQLASLREQLNKAEMLKYEVNRAEQEVKRLERLITKDKNAIKVFKAKHKIENVDALRSLDEVMKEYDALNIEIEESRENINDIKMRLKDNDFAIREHETVSGRIKLVEAALKKARKLQDVLNVCYEAMSPRGIPQYILFSIVEEINTTIPVVVQEFSFWQDIDIVLEADSGKNNNITTWVQIGNKKRREYEGLSTGEKEIVNFIITMSYRRVLENLINVNYSFIMIDEALDVLDERNLESALLYFKKLKMQSLCISHSDIKDMCSRTLVLKSEKGISTCGV